MMKPKQAIDAYAKIIGVNNRNLRNFQVNVENTLNLRLNIPKEILMVVKVDKAAQTLLYLKSANRCRTIGETLMKASDRQAKWLNLEVKIMSKIKFCVSTDSDTNQLAPDYIEWFLPQK